MTDTVEPAKADAVRDPAGQILARPLPAAGLFLGLLAILLLAYHGTVAQIVGRWNSDGGYSHGWLILGLVGWILWERRRRLFSVVAGARWPGYLLGFGASVAWLLGDIISVQAVQHLALLGVMVTLPMMLFGWRGGLPLAGAMGLLLFTVPIWEATIPLLQGMTVRAVDFCLDLTRVPAYIVDNVVNIPSGQFRIVQGCSGMHFFVSGFALAAVYAYLYLRTWPHRVVLVGVTLAVAILANWVRVYVVILAGHLTDMQHFLVTVDHYLFGWIMFGLALIPVFFFAMWLERREERAGLGPETTAAGGASLAGTRILASSVAGLLLILAAPVVGMTLSGDRATEAWCPQGLPALPGWALEPLPGDVWRPDFRGETAAISGVYSKDDAEFVVWILFYEKQRQGQELIYYANRPFDPERWRIFDRTPTHSGVDMPTVSLVLEGQGEQRRRLSYWYEVAGRSTDRRLIAKALQIPGIFSGRADAAFVAVSGLCEDDCKSVDAAVDEFIRVAAPALTREPVAMNCAAGL